MSHPVVIFLKILVSLKVGQLLEICVLWTDLILVVNNCNHGSNIIFMSQVLSGITLVISLTQEHGYLGCSATFFFFSANI